MRGQINVANDVNDSSALTLICKITLVVKMDDQ